eukprot:5036116-Amphidinium_carterae.1
MQNTTFIFCDRVNTPCIAVTHFIVAVFHYQSKAPYIHSLHSLSNHAGISRMLSRSAYRHRGAARSCRASEEL